MDRVQLPGEKVIADLAILRSRLASAKSETDKQIILDSIAALEKFQSK